MNLGKGKMWRMWLRIGAPLVVAGSAWKQAEWHQQEDIISSDCSDHAKKYR
jgi:hypothetical protein